jgi:hypothetical protein
MLNSELCNRLRLAAQEIFSLEEKSFFGIHESVRELVDFLRASADEIERSNLSSLEKLRLVFAPTSDWDDAGGSAQTAEEISHLLDKVRTKQ